MVAKKGDAIGVVYPRKVTTMKIETNIDPIPYDPEIEEYQLVVNGKIISRIHPSRAIRLGIVSERGGEQW